MSILQMFVSAGAGGLYIVQTTTLPRVNNTTYINVGQLVLEANGDYHVVYSVRAQGPLGTADHHLRIACTSDNMGGGGWGHTLSPPNQEGFPGFIGPFLYTMTGDGSPGNLDISSSTGAASRSLGCTGSLIVQVGSSIQALNFFMRDGTASSDYIVSVFAYARKLN